MVDFGKLKGAQRTTRPIDPIEIFRRLPKPPGINDLYTSQASVLGEWFQNRAQRDVVVKLHTGGGKTLVGLLMAQSTMNELASPVLYLVPDNQLLDQTLEKARQHGIAAVAYESGVPFAEAFTSGSAVMVATYRALFNGCSKFRLSGSPDPQLVGAIVLDDAHAAFSAVRDAFSLKVTTEHHLARYQSLVGLFRSAFKDIDKVGTLDDVTSGSDSAVLEVPYWAWHAQLDAVREQLRTDADDFPFEWPLVRDDLRLCHALISRRAFTITPVLPLVHLFPTFVEAKRRIYMSATIADDSEIVRTFDADPSAVSGALTSRSLAGISERMILVPENMPFEQNYRETAEKLAKWVSDKGLGAVVIVPSNRDADSWSEVGEVARGSNQVKSLVSKLQDRLTNGPAIFANRYDGMDLPGDSCRMLVLAGLPKGTSDYELFRATALLGGATATRMLAQRIEQGAGRGARGAADFCVVLLTGQDLAGWIGTDANFRFLTSATRAQLDMADEVSAEVTDFEDLYATIEKCFDRDPGWTGYHAERLAELVDEDMVDEVRLMQAATERKAVDLWRDGYHEKAILTVKKALSKETEWDSQSRGWLGQLAARIADNSGQGDVAEGLQREVFSHNRNLLRPKIRPVYQKSPVPAEQADALADLLVGYHFRPALVQAFDTAVASLHGEASAPQFEQALGQLGEFMGLVAERHDVNGEGPDVLWLLPHKVGLIMEVKSRKKNGPLTKDQHGQLLVAAEWFGEYYPEYQGLRVSVHPTVFATRQAGAAGSFALTLESLARMVSDTRVLLDALSDCLLVPRNEVLAEAARLLDKSPVRSDLIVENYLAPFAESN